MTFHIENLVESAANGLTTVGLILVMSHPSEGLIFTLPIGNPSYSDYLLASGLLIHIGLAMASWWSSSTPASRSAPSR